MTDGVDRVGERYPRRPVVRRARVTDVPAIQRLVQSYAAEGILLGKNMVTLYEDVQEFWIAQPAPGEPIIGCGALHVMWDDLAEVRTLAVDPAHRSEGIGVLLLAQLIEAARQLGVERLFCLTFEVEFFTRHGFEPIDGSAVDVAVHAELLRSGDEGIAEFLDLDHVRPNTLGNTRMMRRI